MDVIRNGNLTVKTAPTVEPVTLSEVKLHLRVDGTDDDTLITNLIKTARITCEKLQRRVYVQTSLEFSLDSVPAIGQEILLPCLPIVSIDSIKITQTNTTAVTIPAAQYSTDTLGGRIKLNDDFATTYDEDLLPDYNGFVIAFKAGYGSAAASVPVTVKQAILLMVGHWYEHREEATDGKAVVEVPFAAQALLQLDRVY